MTKREDLIAGKGPRLRNDPNRPRLIYASPDPSYYQLQPGRIDPNEPVAGFYKVRLRKGAAYSAIRIWHGPPHDPVTGEIMDRSWRMVASINGRQVAADRVWPMCADSGIDEQEYNRLIGLQEWAREHAPESGLQDPSRPIDKLKAPLPF